MVTEELNNLKSLNSTVDTPEKSGGVQRVASIDLLKAVSIVFVVMLHARLDNCEWIESGDDIPLFRYCFRSLLAVSVPMFFFCSGYLSLNKYFDQRKNSIKIIKLLLVTVFWGLVSETLYCLKYGVIISLTDVIEYILNASLGEWTSHLWYIGAFISVLVFLPVIKIAYDSRKPCFVFFCICIFICTFGIKSICYMGSLALSILKRDHILIDKNILGMFNPFRQNYLWCLVYFCIGGLLKSYLPRITKIPRIKRITVSVMIYFISCILFSIMGWNFSIAQGHNWDFAWEGYQTLFVIINVIVLFVMFCDIKSVPSVVSVVSQNTLGIYFMQYITIQFTRELVQTIPLFNTLFGNAIYSTSIVVVLAYLSRFLKKYRLFRIVLA